MICKQGQSTGAFRANQTKPVMSQARQISTTLFNIINFRYKAKQFLLLVHMVCPLLRETFYNMARPTGRQTYIEYNQSNVIRIFVRSLKNCVSPYADWNLISFERYYTSLKFQENRKVIEVHRYCTIVSHFQKKRLKTI